ncbi:MAG: TaqI-like C-terminal specificity domain-containing protein [Prolixibacteraceae bacterium]|nr:TaqI-like C-terminal specificity domain-containing protein [Prolixibacteraceae bacterium]
MFENQEIKKLEAGLKKVRHKLFSAKVPATKRKLREQDKEIRNLIAELLINDGWENQTARQLASWDPYDQNESSPFFDPEWMFDIKEGFDVVIGNPPYGIVKSTNTHKSILSKYQLYYTADFKINLFALFLEKGLILSSKNGVNSFIIPDSSLNLPAFKKLREYILKHSGIDAISHFSENVFENAEVGKSVILQYTKSKKTASFHFRSFKDNQQYSQNEIDLNRVIKDTSLKLVYNSNETNADIILDKLKCISTKLSNYCDVYDGINPGSQEIKNAMITQEVIDDDSKRIIDGKCFSKYSDINWKGDYIYYNVEFVEKLRRKIELSGDSFTGRIIKKFNFFIHDKIVTRQTADTIIGTIDLRKYFVKNSVHSTLIRHEFKDKISLYLILGILNSKLIDWYYRTESLESGRLFPQVKIERLNNLPIIIPTRITTQLKIETIVERLISNKTENFENKLQKYVDEIVFKLYELTYEEVLVIDPDFWLSVEEYAALEIN